MKRYKANISIFLAMVFMVIISLVFTVINYVRDNSCIASIYMLDSMATESTFSDYNRDLFEDFGIYMYKGNSSSLEGTVMSYVSENINDSNTLMNISIDKVKAAKVYSPKYQEGDLFERQVIDYMKYAAPVDLAAEAVKSLLGYEEESPTKKVTDRVIDLGDEVYNTSLNIYNLMSSLDGIQVLETSIMNDGIDVIVNDGFAKQLAKDKNMTNLGCNDKVIYRNMFPKIENPYEMAEKIRILAKQYVNDQDETLKQDLIKEEQKLYALSMSTLDALDMADMYCANIQAEARIINMSSDEIKELLEADKDFIDEELYEALLEESQLYRDFDDISVNKICNVDDLRVAIKRNSQILCRAGFLKNSVVDMQNKKETDIYFQNLDIFIDSLSDYRVDDLVIDYSNVDIFGKSNTSLLKSLKSLYNKGILGLVMGEKAVSSKIVPDRYIVKKTKLGSIDAEALIRNVTFNEYDMRKFASLSDGGSGYSLNYEIEYILQGKNTDEENLAGTITDIIAARELFNLGYLFTDKEKMGEAEELAVSMVGAAGIPGLVTITKFTILSVWAYAESILDAKHLVKGDRVDTIKTKKTFNMTLEKLLAFDFSLTESGKTGLRYEDYLRFLLVIADYGRKNITTLNLMEMHMIADHDKTFRMDSMCMGADFISTYTYNGSSKYIKTSTFSY